MGSGLNGSVYVDIPPPPTLVVAGATFPIAVPPSNNRGYAPYCVDMEGLVTLTHNSASASPSFTLLVWNDPAGWFIPYATIACAQYNQIQWKVFTNQVIYIYASVALGTSKVVIGGVSLQGNLPFVAAGV